MSRGFGIGWFFLCLGFCWRQKSKLSPGQSGIYVVPVLGHWRYKAVASESRRRVVVIGEGLARWASPALKRVVSVFPRCIPSPRPPSPGPSPSPSKPSRVAQTEARMAYTMSTTSRPWTGKGKSRGGTDCARAQGLGGATCFLFLLFFPLHVCLSHFMSVFPTIASPLPRGC